MSVFLQVIYILLHLLASLSPLLRLLFFFLYPTFILSLTTSFLSGSFTHRSSVAHYQYRLSFEQVRRKHKEGLQYIYFRNPLDLSFSRTLTFRFIAILRRMFRP